MTRYGETAYRLRWAMLVAAVLCMVVGVWWLFYAPGVGALGVVGTPATFQRRALDDEWAWEWYIIAATYLGLFLLIQWFFLRPRRAWTVRLATRSRPLKTSIIAAACMAMLLTTGFVTTLLELPDWWFDIAFGVNHIYAIWAVMLVLWAGWALVFFVYWRQGDRYTQLGRMIRGLIAGSILETFIATAVYVANPHKEDCYCARGSYTGLVFGGTVLLWAFGPGVVLLFMREKYRREKLLRGEGYECYKCGYDLRGTIAAGRMECPECGAEVPGEALRSQPGDRTPGRRSGRG